MARSDDLSQIPRAVGGLLERTARELRSSLGSVRLGEGPVVVLCSPGQTAAAWTAVYALESLLGRPAMVRTLPMFEQYSVQAVAARSNVLVLRGAAGSHEALQLLKKVKNRGAIVMAFAGAAENELMKVAHAALSVPSDEEPCGVVLSAIVEHLILVSFAANAARVLRPPSDRIRECERGLSELAGKLDWLFSNLRDATSRFAEELRTRNRVLVSGSGPYHAVALEAAISLRLGLGMESQGAEAIDLVSGFSARVKAGDAVMFLSGSRCRMKKQTQESASRARIEGAEVLSVTDSDDRELVARSARSILIPSMPELPGAMLALALASWVGAVRAPEGRVGA